MVRFRTSIILAFVIFSFAHHASALDETSQRILDLRKQIEELTKQAEQYKGVIGKKQKEANTLQRQIDILNAQIANLTTQITITERTIDKTGLEIQDTSDKIYTTTRSIQHQQIAIGVLINSIYQQDTENLVATLFKHTQLSEAMNQVHYSQSLNTKLATLLTELNTQKSALSDQKTTLETKKTELESLNKKRVSQKVSLDGAKSSKSTILADTKGQEQRYQALLSEVEKKKGQFFGELKSLENQALKNGAFIVHVTADAVPPRGTKLFKFPYEEFTRTQTYGYTAYAKRGVYGGAPHNGIDIVSGPGSAIHPIGNGTVLASGFNTGWGNWVAVRHDGGIVSLYGHMRAPSGIANTTTVTHTDVLGYEGSTGNSTGSHLHLSLYRDFFTFINPKTGQLNFNYFDGTLNPLDYL